MTYDIYRFPPDEMVLFQGDIIDPLPLKDNLKGHQDYFAESGHFYRYMILTQTCDLDHRNQKTGPKADFVSLCVIRKLRDAIGRRYLEKAMRGKTENLLKDIFDHNLNWRGFFYLPAEPTHGIEEDSVADLRVIFTLYKAHYPDLLRARLLGINDLYTAQLGQLAAYLFNRVATPGWADLHCGNRDEHAQETLNLFVVESQQRLEQLKRQYGPTCCFHGCKQEASTFRWLSLISEKTQTMEKKEVTVCTVHALEYDNGRLPAAARLR